MFVKLPCSSHKQLQYIPFNLYLLRLGSYDYWIIKKSKSSFASSVHLLSLCSPLDWSAQPLPIGLKKPNNTQKSVGWKPISHWQVRTDAALRCDGISFQSVFPPSQLAGCEPATCEVEIAITLFLHQKVAKKERKQFPFFFYFYPWKWRQNSTLSFKESCCCLASLWRMSAVQQPQRCQVGNAVLSCQRCRMIVFRISELKKEKSVVIQWVHLVVSARFSDDGGPCLSQSTTCRTHIT